MDTIPVVWTNDDIFAGRSEQLKRQLDFLDSFGIPGVFFVIPYENGDAAADDRNIAHDKELIKTIESARNQGHEFYQHGYMHFAFECGVPQQDMFALDAKAKALFDADRDYVESLHTLEAQVEMLEKGQKIWREAFGEASVGFRPGWGSYCGNLYKALHILGYQWVSSRIPSMTAYLQKYGEPVAFYEGIKTEPHRLSQGITEFPIGPEIAWRIPNSQERINAMVDLGMAHFHAMVKRKEPMLMLSHFHGLEFRGKTEGNSPLPSGTGYAVHAKFLPKLLDSGKARFVGMKELVANYTL